MATGVLYMSFSETVQIENFFPSQITFQNSATTPTATFKLTGGTKSELSETEIELKLKLVDLNAIKADDMAFTAASTYLSATEGFITDAADQDVTAVVGKAVASGGYIADNVKPTLVSFKLDMNTEMITLSFSETILRSSFQPGTLTLRRNQLADDAFTHTFSAATVPEAGGNGDTIALIITKADMDEIKNVVELASSATTTYIEFPAGMFTDVASDGVSNNLVAVIDTAAKAVKVGGYQVDTTPPQLETFSFDINSHTVTMNFNEPIKSTNDLTAIDIQSARSIPSVGSVTDAGFDAAGTKLSLTGGSTALSADGMVLTVTLDSADVNAMTEDEGLAKDEPSTWVRCAFSGSNLHSRMPLDPTHVRLKRTRV
jgi:hypothetical protein